MQRSNMDFWQHINTVFLKASHDSRPTHFMVFKAYPTRYSGTTANGGRLSASCGCSKSKGCWKIFLVRKDLTFGGLNIVIVQSHAFGITIELDIRKTWMGSPTTQSGHPWPIWCKESTPFISTRRRPRFTKIGFNHNSLLIQLYYIKIATKHELMKRLSWKLCSMSLLNAVSCWWRISGPNEGSPMAHLVDSILCHDRPCHTVHKTQGIAFPCDMLNTVRYVEHW